MLAWLSRRFLSKPNSAAQLYASVVAAARRPGWYIGGGIPDMPVGRMTLIALHLSLLVERLNDQPALSQAIYDLCLSELDGAAREMAVSDQRIGQNVQAFAQRLAGMMTALQQAGTDQDALSDVLTRNLFANQPPSANLPRLYADYCIRTRAALAEQLTQSLQLGQCTWPPIPFAETDET